MAGRLHHTTTTADTISICVSMSHISLSSIFITVARRFVVCASLLLYLSIHLFTPITYMTKHPTPYMYRSTALLIWYQSARRSAYSYTSSDRKMP